eukprot:XP_011675860.1 PREDICTED: nucleolar and coiled-body phosphoprotein 1 [Strongylocentrotus purpuratus]
MDAVEHAVGKSTACEVSPHASMMVVNALKNALNQLEGSQLTMVTPIEKRARSIVSKVIKTSLENLLQSSHPELMENKPSEEADKPGQGSYELDDRLCEGTEEAVDLSSIIEIFQEPAEGTPSITHTQDSSESESEAEEEDDAVIGIVENPILMDELLHAGGPSGDTDVDEGLHVVMHKADDGHLIVEGAVLTAEHDTQTITERILSDITLERASGSLSGASSSRSGLTREKATASSSSSSSEDEGEEIPEDHSFIVPIYQKNLINIGGHLVESHLSAISMKPETDGKVPSKGKCAARNSFRNIFRPDMTYCQGSARMLRDTLVRDIRSRQTASLPGMDVVCDVLEQEEHVGRTLSNGDPEDTLLNADGTVGEDDAPSAATEESARPTISDHAPTEQKTGIIPSSKSAEEAKQRALSAERRSTKREVSAQSVDASQNLAGSDEGSSSGEDTGSRKHGSQKSKKVKSSSGISGLFSRISHVFSGTHKNSSASIPSHESSSEPASRQSSKKSVERLTGGAFSEGAHAQDGTASATLPDDNGPTNPETPSEDHLQIKNDSNNANTDSGSQSPHLLPSIHTGQLQSPQMPSERASASSQAQAGPTQSWSRASQGSQPPVPPKVKSLSNPSLSGAQSMTITGHALTPIGSKMAKSVILTSEKEKRSSLGSVIQRSPSSSSRRGSRVGLSHHKWTGSTLKIASMSSQSASKIKSAYGSSAGLSISGCQILPNKPSRSSSYSRQQASLISATELGSRGSRSKHGSRDSTVMPRPPSGVKPSGSAQSGHRGVRPPSEAQGWDLFSIHV